MLNLQNVAVYRQLQVTTSPSIVTYISIYYLWRHFFYKLQFKIISIALTSIFLILNLLQEYWSMRYYTLR